MTNKYKIAWASLYGVIDCHPRMPLSPCGMLMYYYGLVILLLKNTQIGKKFSGSSIVYARIFFFKMVV